VASDHGQLTGATKIDVAALLRSAGFDAGHDHDTDIWVVPGPMTSVYTKTEKRADEVELWLHKQPWCGLVFRRPGQAGSRVLSMDLVGIDHARSADLVFTFGGSDRSDHAGAVGVYAFDGDLPARAGMHGGLHRRELSNVLIARGSAFASGLQSDVPAGLIDIAPTIVDLLGLGLDQFDGRVLGEGLADPRPALPVTTEILTAAAGPRGAGLRIRRVGGRHFYLAGDLASYEPA
jgi:hypothetical protein